MIEIKLEDGQNGYDVIGEYIRRYWKHNMHDNVVVSLSTSYDGKKYSPFHIVADPVDYLKDDILYDFDWWEGEKFIKLFGIINVSKLDISGGIYMEG